MSRYFDRLIAEQPPGDWGRTERLSRQQVEALIRATVLKQGAVISDAGVRRIADEWLRDTDLAYSDGYDAGYYNAEDI